MTSTARYARALEGSPEGSGVPRPPHVHADAFRAFRPRSSLFCARGRSAPAPATVCEYGQGRGVAHGPRRRGIAAAASQTARRRHRAVGGRSHATATVDGMVGSVCTHAAHQVRWGPSNRTWPCPAARAAPPRRRRSSARERTVLGAATFPSWAFPARQVHAAERGCGAADCRHPQKENTRVSRCDCAAAARALCTASASRAPSGVSSTPSPTSAGGLATGARRVCASWRPRVAPPARPRAVRVDRASHFAKRMGWGVRVWCRWKRRAVAAARCT